MAMLKDEGPVEVAAAAAVPQFQADAAPVCPEPVPRLELRNSRLQGGCAVRCWPSGPGQAALSAGCVGLRAQRRRNFAVIVINRPSIVDDGAHRLLDTSLKYAGQSVQVLGLADSLTTPVRG